LTAAVSQRSVSTEREVRRDLAAAYRLAARFGWADTVYTHLSATVPGEPGAYLLNRFGLLFNEITASNLVKVNLRGEVIDGTGARINPSGFAIHGCVHAARPDAICVMHLHTRFSVALSMRPEGLLMASQGAMRFHQRLGQHAYEGLAFDAAEQTRLVQHLGALDGLVLHNHGCLLLGRTVAEAFMLTYLLERAAMHQLTAQAAGGALCVVSDEVAARTYRQWVGDGSVLDGDDEWPALVRGLQNTDPDFND
jgi:ribulose-5-phosphate 4-epimerase/fuculose-1-phosphate aldolase